MLPAVTVAVDETDDMIVVRPTVMTAHSFVVEQIEIFAVAVGSQKEGLPVEKSGAADRAPAEKKSETFIIWTAKQMIDPADIVVKSGVLAEIPQLFVTEKQSGLSAFQIQFPDTVIVGGVVKEIVVPDSGVTVTGAFPVEAGEVQTQRITAVVGKAVDGAVIGVQNSARSVITEAGDEMIVLKIVENNRVIIKYKLF